MRTEQYEAIESYLRDAVPARNISIEQDDSLGVNFVFRHEITGVRHVVRVSMEFLDDTAADQIGPALGDLRLSEHIERAGETIVRVTIQGIRIGDGG
jgi:hypothetical protein